MGFTDAVKSCLNQYVGFYGRAPRSEYWWFMLFQVIVAVATMIIDGILGTMFINVLASLALLLPTLAVTIRRLHDTDRSGWWIFIALVPLIGFIVLLVFYLQRGTEGQNSHGPNPFA